MTRLVHDHKKHRHLHATDLRNSRLYHETSPSTGRYSMRYTVDENQILSGDWGGKKRKFWSKNEFRTPPPKYKKLAIILAPVFTD